MSTPLGHSLMAAAIVPLTGKPAMPAWRLWLFALFAANGPDLDLLAGLPYHDPNLFHQGPSHSLSFALLFGVLSGMFFRSARAGMIGLLCYASHLLLDFFTYDGRPPYGIPLLWPFSEDYRHAPFDLFMGVRHGVPGDSPAETLSQIFSWYNVRTLLVESTLLAPLTAASLFLSRRIGRTT